MSTITGLFNDGAALRTFGYTSLMLRTLRDPMVWTSGSRVRTLGNAAGVSDIVIQRCLSRMKCWLVLAKATIEAEFPAFEVSQAFDRERERGEEDRN